jgi:cyclohexadieny/prephenate dehydrogenase
VTGPIISSRLAIIGIGLIGSSIALAAKAKGVAEGVILFDADPDVRRRAALRGLGVVAETVTEAVQGADIVVLCTPSGAMGVAAAALSSALANGAIVTDVGSVKAQVIESVRPHIPDHALFVPGHPIAGTEQSGPEAGFPELFTDRWTILCPLEDERPAYSEAVTRLTAFWEGLGARVECMDAKRHDLVLAITSHIPHLIAFQTVATASDLETVTESEVVKYSAGGFRDFTRIAASDPTMWRDVFLMNREAVLDVLGRFSEDLTALRRAIRWGDGDALFKTFERARHIRREVIEAGQDISAPNFGRNQRED